MIIVAWIIAILLLIGVVSIEILKLYAKLSEKGMMKKADNHEEVLYAIDIYNSLNVGVKMLLAINISGYMISTLFHNIVNIGRDK